MSDDRELELEHKNETEDTSGTEDGRKDSYEEYCFVCHRPESVAGKMVHLPQNIHICSDYRKARSYGCSSLSL